MRNALFYGSGVALVTPFSGDKVDFRAFEALIHWQIDMLTDAIVILGTTGEPCTIAPSERAALIECAVSTVAGRDIIFPGRQAGRYEVFYNAWPVSYTHLTLPTSDLV